MKHFTPAYKPWDQRLCPVPGGDSSGASAKGKASVVTDHIDTFTETGSGSAPARSSRPTSGDGDGPRPSVPRALQVTVDGRVEAGPTR